MTYLSQAKKSVVKPPIITLIAFPGAGKSSLAALFPKPIFIQAEDSSTVFQSWPEELQPLLLPQIPEPNAKRNIRPKQVVMDQLREIYDSEHEYQTLVIDTTTAMQMLFEREVIESEGGEKSIQDCVGGFQKAYDVIATWHSDIIKACMKIRDKRNMTIIFLAHTDEHKRKSHPEIASEYTVYGIRMHKKSRDYYISESDVVMYMKQDEIITGAKEDKKGTQVKQGRIKKSGDRYLVTSSDGLVGFVDAKSRYEMPQEIEVPKGGNPVMQYIPFYGVKPEVKEEVSE